ncbi:MAG: hypothetical protein J5889_08335, partial [Clostridia bacterium]|nr:hypothetical protein [Clostridia bacterium]
MRIYDNISSDSLFFVLALLCEGGGNRVYQALYRKWRSRTFSEMVGQEAVIRTLRHQVASGRIAHAYLFCGSHGTGKTSAAKIMARAINCLHPVDGDPC